jgi:hypothetical protein
MECADSFQLSVTAKIAKYRNANVHESLPAIKGAVSVQNSVQACKTCLHPHIT